MAALWAWQLQRRLHCELSLGESRLHVGDSLQVKMRLEVEGLVPLPWAEVNHETPGHLVLCDEPHQATSAASFGSRVLTFQLRARRRGHYRIGPVTAITGDGFGLFRVTRTIYSQRPITVYPRVVRLQEMPIPLGQPFGHVRTRQKAFVDPFSLAGIRPYQPGDSLRHIHWAVSARRGELYLKQFELNATTDLALVIDLAAGAHRVGPNGDTSETAVEVAASLADYGARRNLGVSLLAVGRERFQVPLARGARAMGQVMEALARMESNGQRSLAQVLHTEATTLPPRATLALITPQVDEALAQAVLRLRTTHPLLLVAIRAETYDPAVAAAEGPQAAERERLLALLAAVGVPVYAVAARSDLSQLPLLRVKPPLPAGAGHSPADGAGSSQADRTGSAPPGFGGPDSSAATDHSGTSSPRPAPGSRAAATGGDAQ